jgi:Flp pilus assembly protein TadD
VLHYHLGVILIQASRPQEAVEEFEKALESQPNSFPAREELGNLLLRLNRTDEAAVRYRELQQLRPYDPTVYINLGNFFIRTGHFAEGVAQLEEALRLSPSDQTALNNLSMVLTGCQDPALRDLPRALELARTLNQLSHHSNPVFLATLATACAEDGRLDEAADLMEKAAGIAERQGNSPLSETLRTQSATYRERIPR